MGVGEAAISAIRHWLLNAGQWQCPRLRAFGVARLLNGRTYRFQGMGPASPALCGTNPLHLVYGTDCGNQVSAQLNWTRTVGLRPGRVENFVLKNARLGALHTHKLPAVAKSCWHSMQVDAGNAIWKSPCSGMDESRPASET